MTPVRPRPPGHPARSRCRPVRRARAPGQRGLPRRARRRSHRGGPRPPACRRRSAGKRCPAHPAPARPSRPRGGRGGPGAAARRWRTRPARHRRSGRRAPHASTQPRLVRRRRPGAAVLRPPRRRSPPRRQRGRPRVADHRGGRARTTQPAPALHLRLGRHRHRRRGRPRWPPLVRTTRLGRRDRARDRRPPGSACPCGSTGCLEQYAGRRALLTAAGLDPEDTTAELAAARPSRTRGPPPPSSARRGRSASPSPGRSTSSTSPSSSSAATCASSPRSYGPASRGPSPTVCSPRVGCHRRSTRAGPSPPPAHSARHTSSWNGSSATRSPSCPPRPEPGGALSG